MQVKTRALVLHMFKFNDDTSLATLFTEAEGCVTFRVHVPKTSKARVKYKLFQPLALLDIEWEYHPSLSIQHIYQCICTQPYTSLPYDPVKSCISLFLAEVLYHGLKNEHSSQLYLFNYIVSSLQWLDWTPDSYSNFHLVFMTKLAEFLGFMPNMESDVNLPYFDMRNSCFVGTQPSHPHFLTGEETRIVPLLMKMEFSTMHLVSFSRQQRNRILNILNDYYRLHIPEFPRLKSIEYMHEIFG